MRDYYSYQEIKERALKYNSTPEDRIKLFVWHEKYDPSAWNGEVFCMEDGITLKPVYIETTEDEFNLIDCQIMY